MKTFDPDAVPTQSPLHVQLEYLEAHHGGPKDGETAHEWVERLFEAGHCVLGTRAQSRDARWLQAAQDEARANGVPLVLVNPPKEELEGPVIRVPREALKDPATYRRMKREADEREATLIGVDEDPGPPSGAIALTREEARDMTRLREAKAEAAEKGVDVWWPEPGDPNRGLL